MKNKTDYELVEKYSLIVDDFVVEHRRIPTKEEFVKHGGYLPFITYHYESYNDFINSLGYDENIKRMKTSGRKYYVIDTKYNNKLICHVNMIGLMKKFPNKTHEGIRGAIYQHQLVGGRYRILRSLDEVKLYE